MYPIYRVESFDRRTRRTLDIHAEGLTMNAAHDLAATLRRDNLADEDVIGYGISTMPLHRQAELLASNEAMQLAA